MKCPLFTGTWHFKGVSYVCGVCQDVVAEVFFVWWFLFCFVKLFSPVICNGSLHLFWTAFGPCGFVGQSGLTLHLGSYRLGICQRWGSNKLQVFVPCCPLRSVCWWTGPAVRLAVCPQPAAGFQSAGLRVLFSSVWCGSHFGVVLACQGCWHAARPGAPPWMGFGQQLVGGGRAMVLRQV